MTYTFFGDASLADDVHLLPRLFELGLLKVRGSGKRRAEDFICLDVKPEAIKLGLVSGTRLGAVVGHEEDALSHGTQLGQSGWHVGDECVAEPDDAVAVEDEHV